VEATKAHATYTLLDGEPLEIAHHGERFTIIADEPAKLGIPEPVSHQPPEQPTGRAPARRAQAAPGQRTT
jgi:alpha,alpha-trehalose phosphorylase